MRVDARRGYRNFKAYVTAAARTRGKHVSAQDGHVVGRFVVAAMDDFVDACKDSFFVRVKLLYQLFLPRRKLI